MHPEWPRWTGDLAAACAVAAAVYAACRSAAAIVRSESAALAAESDSRCRGEALRVLASGIGRIAAARGLGEYVADIDRLLLRAGRTRLHGGRELAGRGILAVLAGVVVMPLLWWAGGAALVLVAATLVALYAASIRSGLSSAADLRKREIEAEMPYTLDLLGLCMSARASEIEALAVAARGEPRTAMTDVIESMKWECERNVSIAQSVARVGRELEIEALVRLGQEIERSRSRGTDLPETLKTLADSERRRRFDNAEAYASEVSTRMLGPSGLVFASALLLMLGPVVMSFLLQGGI